MTYDRYYYSILSKREKKVYKLIYKGIERLDYEISIPLIHCVGVDISHIVHCILLDNPHIFYVDRNEYQGANTLFDLVIRFKYLYTAGEVKKLQVKINTVIRSMLKKVAGTTDYEKEKSVHDLIAQNVSYDDAALNNFQKYSSRSNTILGVLFYKTAVCEGIALTVKYLLNILDIKCIVAIGDSLRNDKGEGQHAWNVVRVGGENYHLDVTWDLSENNESISYDYFNLNDEDIKKDHEFESIYPKCGFKTYNYFVFNDFIVTKKSDVKRIVDKALSDKSNYICFKCGDNVPRDSAEKYALSLLGSGRFLSADNPFQNTVFIRRQS